jgi:hypothetical protein
MTLRFLAVLALLLVASGCGDDGGSRARTGPGPDDTTATTAPVDHGSPGAAAGTTVPTTSTAPAPQPIPDHPVVDDRGVLYRIALPPGECQSCAFELELRLDGTASYTAPDEHFDAHTVSVDYDAPALVELLTLVEGHELVAGPTDCGREVDGNAPVFALGPGPEIDTCYQELDAAHPVNVFVSAVHDQAAGAHERALAR